jgi:prephenate dehydrogenase
MKTNLAVIGLDRIGVSIGMALVKNDDEIECTGIDLDPKKVQAANNSHAFYQVTSKLDNAVQVADLVLVDLPLDEVKDIFSKIAQWIKKDAVLLYFSALPGIASGWAGKVLPSNVHFVALTPSINPNYIEESDQSTPKADLFENSQMLISHNPSIPPGVIQSAVDFTNMLGSKPCFADLAEVDGLQTIAQFLPRISAAAVMEEALNEPGWKDASKLAGDDLANATRLLNSIMDENQGQLLIENKENSLRVISNLQISLVKMAQLINAGDHQKLQEHLESLRMGREKWLGSRRDVQPKKKTSLLGRK